MRTDLRVGQTQVVGAARSELPPRSGQPWDRQHCSISSTFPQFFAASTAHPHQVHIPATRPQFPLF